MAKLAQLEAQIQSAAGTAAISMSQADTDEQQSFRQIDQQRAAGSRMILFVPGGFIFGGYGVPLTLLPEWVRWFNQIFPLTWEFKFIRDVVFRGPGLWIVP